MTDLAAGEFVAGFVAEAEEHLAHAGKRLLALDAAARAGKAEPRAVRELFRSLHTIKGLAAMIGVDAIADLAHAMESVLRAADRGAAVLSVEAVDRLVQGARAIEERVVALGKGDAVAAAPRALVDALAAVEPVAAVPDPAALPLPPDVVDKLGASEREQIAQALQRGASIVRMEFAPSPEHASRGTTITTVREAVAARGDLVKVVPRSVAPDASAPNGLVFTLVVITDAPPEDLCAAAALPAGAALRVEPEQRAPQLALDDMGPLHEEDERAADARAKGFVRVDVKRLDEALDRLAALVVSRMKLERAAGDLQQRGADVRDLRALLAEQARQLRDLRAAVMQARMVSVAELLERVPLLVRGVAKATGKQVRLVVSAGRAELDKGVAERVFPALVHMVRNAVDHAIERPDERARLGKPVEGVIEVLCDGRSSRMLEVVVKDDGRGIDRAAVAAKAGAPVPADDDGLLALLCRPGFSTRDVASTTSGRGVGMDVVKRIADELGGDLSLTTTPGKGSAFTLRIPLSITILDVITFRAGGQRFVVPASTIEEIVELDAARALRPPTAGGALVVERRGGAMPVLSLARGFGLPAPPLTGDRVKALVVRRGGEPCAFAVEAVFAQQEVVVRPLEDPLVRVVGVTGATDLGDGRPTLVVDLVALAGARAASPDKLDKRDKPDKREAT